MKLFWSLDLAEPKPHWRELEPWPGPARMLAAAGVCDGAFYLFSGVELTGDAAGKPVRRYFEGRVSFHPGQGWKRITDLRALPSLRHRRP